jgi:hypothetical protein
VSIKDELNYVKTELSADEKVLESAFRLESFLKKHKTKLTILAVTLVAAAVAYNGYAMYKASELKAANRALAVLEKNPSDAQALALLRKNAPQLYAHVRLREAAQKQDVKTLRTLQSGYNDIVADMSRYHAGAAESKPVDSKLYHELALLEEAYNALKNGDRETAKNKLELIDERSPAAAIAALLRHATVKVKE